MKSSKKCTIALMLGVCLAISESAEAQLFQRVTPQESYSQSKQAKKTKQAAQKTIVKKGPAASLKSETKQVAYNSFDSSGLDGFSLDGESIEPMPMESYDCGPTGECCGDCGPCCDCMQCCGTPRCIGDRPGQFFFAGEYIYARASFSEALAYVISDSNQPQDGPEWVEYDFDYESSYRFYGGYRLCDCGGAIMFNYSRYRSGAAFEAVEDAINIDISAPYEIDPREVGGFIRGSADVDLDSYDLAFSKTIPLGCPLGCCNTCCDTCCGDACCDTCCDTCCGSGCGNWCPAWDITWFAGIRFADGGWSRITSAFDEGEDSPFEASRTRLSFEGVGPRVGVLGRRYFGCSGCVSAYARGDISLLVGNMKIRTDIQDFESSVPQFQDVVSHRNSGRRMIPVTEIEAGLTVHLCRSVQISSGYFVSAWHDLGMRDEYDFQGGGFQLALYDDANILGFDGLFARAEIMF